MSIILNIDTATENAIISIAREGKIQASLTNNALHQHASFLQKGIGRLTNDCGIHLSTIDAIAVVHGPGSYTGIRVGMASAKGLCYALKKPLIAINTLEIMATSAMVSTKAVNGGLFCPMLDARRMEVFTAIYDSDCKEILHAAAVILTSDFCKELLQENKILFFGNGSYKWQKICPHPNANFQNIETAASAMGKISYNKLINNDLCELMYSEPLYLKDFFTGK